MLEAPDVPAGAEASGVDVPVPAVALFELPVVADVPDAPYVPDVPGEVPEVPDVPELPPWSLLDELEPLPEAAVTDEA